MNFQHGSNYYAKALTCRASLQELVKLMLKSLYIILIAKVIVWIIVGSSVGRGCVEVATC